MIEKTSEMLVGRLTFLVLQRIMRFKVLLAQEF